MSKMLAVHHVGRFATFACYLIDLTTDACNSCIQYSPPTFTMLSGIPYCLRINHNEGQHMQSKAFEKSIKFIITGLCHAVTFSTICLSAKTWSQHDPRGLNCACSCCKSVSILLLSLLSTMLANTLSDTDSSVMPRQLLQSDRSPF